MQRNRSRLFQLVFILGVTFVLTVSTIGCDGSGGGSDSANPIQNTWYYGDTRAIFYDDGTYDVSMWNVDAWESVESGTYNYDSENNKLSAEITDDTNDRGFGSSAGDKITVDVLQLSSTALKISNGDDDDEYLLFSLNEPNLPTTATITDDFNDNSINTDYWYVESDDGEIKDVIEADERLYLSVYNPPTRLRMAGYSKISVDITATSSETKSNMHIKFSPFNSEYTAEMGIQNDWNGDIVLFGQVYGGDPYMWQVLRVINHDETYNIEMEWDGTDIHFYIDDIWQHKYTPNPASINLPFPIDHRLSVWDGGVDNEIEGYVDNFTVEQ